MPNITSFNVSDASLYYQALVAIGSTRMGRATAEEEVRRRLITFLERRRALFSLPPLRGELTTLGEKVLVELRQMGLVSIGDDGVALTAAGEEIAHNLKANRGREARFAVLGRLIETFDNVGGLCRLLTPPAGRPLHLPLPRAVSEEMDEEDAETKVVSENMAAMSDSWRRWCESERRLDLLPADFQHRTEELVSLSKDRGGFASKARNAMAQVVLETVTGGRLARPAVFRTIRDRLSTAGGMNSVICEVAGEPLAVEVVFSCLHLGKPVDNAKEWQAIGAKLAAQGVWIHEAEPERLADVVLTSMRRAMDSLKERAGYYRIFEVRDRVCEDLALSQGMFDSVFVHLYRTRPALMTLGVDYEKITAKRLPIEIRDGTSSNLFNLVALKKG